MCSVRSRTEQKLNIVYRIKAPQRDSSQTGCWKNNYWMPVSSSDVNKSGLVPQLSDTTSQRKIKPQSLQYTTKVVTVTIFFFLYGVPLIWLFWMEKKLPLMEGKSIYLDKFSVIKWLYSLQKSSERKSCMCSFVTHELSYYHIQAK